MQHVPCCAHSIAQAGGSLPRTKLMAFGGINKEERSTSRFEFTSTAFLEGRSQMGKYEVSGEGNFQGPYHPWRQISWLQSAARTVSSTSSTITSGHHILPESTQRCLCVSSHYPHREPAHTVSEILKVFILSYIYAELNSSLHSAGSINWRFID